MIVALNSLRFEDIRQNIIDYLKQNGQYSANFDYKGSNFAYLINVMAYSTMLLSYQISNIPNNLLLDTTDIRKNAVSLAKMIGYRPRRPVSSKITSKLIYNGSGFKQGDYISIDPGAVFFTNSGKEFVNEEKIILTYKDDPNTLSGDFEVKEGVSKVFTTLGSGKSLQEIVIPATNIEEYSLKTFIYESNVNPDDVNSEYSWREVANFNEFSNKNMKIFFVEEDIKNEGCPKIIFGDGLLGQIPKNSEIIEIRYLETQGSKANGEYLVKLPEDKSKFVFKKNNLVTQIDLTKFDSSFSDQNNLSYGGTDLENIEKIKHNAPKYYGSVGRAVTKEDYLKIFSYDTTIKSANVIGGDETTIFGENKLGTIFISAVPKAIENNNTNKIFFNRSQESKIISEISKVSIISTKKEFKKPTYIFLDITPNIVFNDDVSLGEKILVKKKIFEALNTFVDNTYSELGVNFKKIKLETVIEAFGVLSEVNVVIDYSFLLNHDFFDGLEEKSVILPVLAIKDLNGNIIGYDNFVNTNYDLINQKNSYDFSIMSAIEAIRKKSYSLHLQKNTPHSERTMFGEIYHKDLYRYFYNSDYEYIKIAKVDIFGDIVIKDIQTFDFIDSNNDLVNVTYEKMFDDDITKTVLTYNIKFNKLTGDLVPASAVAQLKVDIINKKTSVVFTDEEQKDILVNFGIFVTFESPFKIEYYPDRIELLMIRQLINKSVLHSGGINKLVDFNFEQIASKDQVKESTLKTFNYNTGLVTLSTSPVLNGAAEIKFPAANIAKADQTIFTITRNYNPKFKGYKFTRDLVYDFLSTPPSAQSLTKGDFVKIVDNSGYLKTLNTSLDISLDIESSGRIIENGDYIFYNGASANYFSFVKLKADLAFNDPSQLLINNEHGNIIKLISPTSASMIPSLLSETGVSGDMYMFNVYQNSSLSGTNTIYPKYNPLFWEKMKKRTDNGFSNGISSLDTLPKNIKNQQLIIVMNESITANGVSAVEWDILKFKTTSSPSGSYEKMYNLATDEFALPMTVTDLNQEKITSLNDAFDNPSINVIKIVAPSGEVTFGVSGSQTIEWSDPSYPLAMDGDYLIKLTGVSKKWALVDTITQGFDITVEKKLPSALYVGNYFDVISTSGTSGNFNGETEEFYTNGDKIVYLGINPLTQEHWWSRLNIQIENYSPSALNYKLPSPPEVGDCIKISFSGNFNNSPLIKTSSSSAYYNSKMCVPGDYLIYEEVNGISGWYKLNEYSIIPSRTKQYLNDLGLNYNGLVKLDESTGYFGAYFYDIYNESKVADIDYKSGKVTFVLNNEIIGKTGDDSLTNTNPKVYLKDFVMNSENKPYDKINLIPKTKVVDGVLTSDKISDFDTIFNQYILTNVLPISSSN